MKLFIKKLFLVKAPIFLGALTIFSIQCKAQQQFNLINNYSFEINSNCAVSTGGAGADLWYSPVVGHGGQYSYFNSCTSQLCCGVPSNTFGNGWQYARTGNAYTGAFFSKNNGGNDRIYLQTVLTNKLIINRCYYIEFYVNLFNNSIYATNNISLLVGDTGIVSYKGKLASAIPQIQQYGNPIILDTLNWVKVGGIYIAHGGEQYITIGNFIDDVHNDTINFQKTGRYSAGYNIDDVSVIPLDSMQLKADAGRDTTIVKGDSIWIGSRLCGLTNVVWYDAANNVIDTGAPGLWVKPTSNTFYVIEQDVCGQYSRDTVFVNVQPLPVTLLSFNVIASAAKQSESINWESASEINTSHFNIQRSTDGSTFNTIGTVKAKGASTYTFNDPLTTNDSRFTTLYYRLEIVDKNGAISYSDIREIVLSKDNGINVYPNPTRGVLNIELPEKGNWQIVATDISGRIIWEQQCKGCNGIIKHDLNSSKGLYCIKITNVSSGEQTIKKVILQ